MTQSANMPVMIDPIMPPMNGPKPTYPICEALKVQGGPEKMPAKMIAEPTYLDKC